eukprot:3630947-Prorocentrum_lima.AAC.1
MEAEVPLVREDQDSPLVVVVAAAVADPSFRGEEGEVTRDLAEEAAHQEAHHLPREEVKKDPAT